MEVKLNITLCLTTVQVYTIMIQYLYICVASYHHKCLVNTLGYKLFYYRTFKVYYLVTFKNTIYIISHHVACYISRTQLLYN